MRKIILFFTLMVIVSCGSFVPYAKIDNASPLSLQNKKVALLGINVPVDIVEKNVALKLSLADDFLKLLKHKQADIYRLQFPEKKELQTKIYKNDLYNWFFRSDSFILESSQSKIDVSDLDYIIEINVLNYEKGMTKSNDWIEFTVLFYSSTTKELLNTISGRGFYSTVLKEMTEL